MQAWLRGTWMLMVGLAAAGCSNVRVSLKGDSGVRYAAAWTSSEGGTQTRSGPVPASFKFDGPFHGWFQNATGTGALRVRVYEGFVTLVDLTIEDRPGRVFVERKDRGVSYRVE